MLDNVPTAALVNAVMDKLFEWENEGKVPLDTLLDMEFAYSNLTLRMAVQELNRRQERMPIADLVKKEDRRRMKKGDRVRKPSRKRA
jgi:hypothetical protein